MDKENISKIGAKLILQTIAIILFIAVCTYFIMKLIDRESDSLPILFIGFGAAFLIIVLIAIYINYVVNMYIQIKKLKDQEKSMEINELRNKK
jgi:hypothetical protein